MLKNSIVRKFQRDIRFLEKNELPMEQYGERIDELDYKIDSSDEETQLNDDDIKQLSDSLMKNDTFQGPLDLSNNNLTDLSCLYLQDALQREGAVNITKLILSKNKGLKLKAGIYIGNALIKNTQHPIKKISFKDVYLGEDGLIRIIEACNANSNIEKAHFGYVSQKGMMLMADSLKDNKTLNKIKFQEHLDKDKRWDDSCKEAFSAMLQSNTQRNLKKVKFEVAQKKVQDHKSFKKEVEFFVSKIQKEQKSQIEFAERIESCSNDHMFENLLKLIEDPNEHQKMPVRKFFMNTFGTLLNDAIFALTKKQQKNKSQASLLTMQGSIKFVAQYLQDHLPENEANEGDSEEENDETDEV